MKNELTQESVINQLNRFAAMFIKAEIIRGEFKWKCKAILEFAWQMECISYLQAKALEDQMNNIVEDKVQKFIEPDVSWIDEAIQDCQDEGCRNNHINSEQE